MLGVFFFSRQVAKLSQQGTEGFVMRSLNPVTGHAKRRKSSIHGMKLAQAGLAAASTPEGHMRVATKRPEEQYGDDPSPKVAKGTVIPKERSNPSSRETTPKPGLRTVSPGKGKGKGGGKGSGSGGGGGGGGSKKVSASSRPNGSPAGEEAGRSTPSPGPAGEPRKNLGSLTGSASFGGSLRNMMGMGKSKSRTKMGKSRFSQEASTKKKGKKGKGKGKKGRKERTSTKSAPVSGADTGSMGGIKSPASMLRSLMSTSHKDVAGASPGGGRTSPQKKKSKGSKAKPGGAESPSTPRSMMRSLMGGGGKSPDASPASTSRSGSGRKAGPSSKAAKAAKASGGKGGGAKRVKSALNKGKKKEKHVNFGGDVSAAARKKEQSRRASNLFMI